MWLWYVVIDVDVVEVKANGQDVSLLFDVVFEVTGCAPIVVVVVL